MFLAVIETQSNQPYIFMTNRQAAAVGGSHLLWSSCTSWVVEAALGVRATDPESVRAAVRAQSSVAEFAADTTAPVHVVIAASGRTVLLAHRRDQLSELISTLTTRAIVDAPCLGLRAGVAEFDWNGPPVSVAGGAPVGAFWAAMGTASERSKRHWAAMQQPDVRFRRLPLVRDCSLTPLPSSVTRKVGDAVLELSAPAAAQVRARGDAQQRIESVLGGHSQIDANADRAAARANRLARVAPDVGDIESDWICVVHADGNGFGALFGALGAVLPTDTEQGIAEYRSLSLSLEECAEASLCVATDAIPDLCGPSLYPIVFGGDDLTVVLQGAAAVPFTLAYLREFASRTTGVLARIRSNFSNPDPLPTALSSRAGLAFVKPKFPFHAAYSLADELCDSAKSLVRDGGNGPAGTLDFHVLYDSSSASLEDIRDRRTSTPDRRNEDDDTVRLYGGPYEVEDFDARYSRHWSTPTPRSALSTMRTIALGYARATSIGRAESKSHPEWKEQGGNGATWSPVSDAIDLIEVTRDGLEQ